MEEKDDFEHRTIDQAREVAEVIPDTEGVLPGFAEISSVDV